jgi:hypothetical protein
MPRPPMQSAGSGQYELPDDLPGTFLLQLSPLSFRVTRTGG